MPSDKQTGNNGNLKPWTKGQSGNPKGRPPKGKAWSDVANEMLDACEVTLTISTPDGKSKTRGLKCYKTFREAIIFSQIAEALQGNVPAQRELADRTEGKPNQRIEANITDLPKGFATKRI